MLKLLSAAFVGAMLMAGAAFAQSDDMPPKMKACVSGCAPAYSEARCLAYCECMRDHVRRGTSVRDALVIGSLAVRGSKTGSGLTHDPKVETSVPKCRSAAEAIPE